ncbi:MAG: Crp/Fnr family transcriptional regulator [Peptostreptococcaceae bacterium]|nr:Crp/Fnr family transcriptional regulator [Peptostreptococcaceae bacterium]
MINILAETELFRGISNMDITHILGCLGSRKNSYQKGKYIFMEGETNPKVGIILSGKVQVVKETKNGDLILINQLKTGDIFGLSHVCSQIKKLPISILAVEPSEILFIELNQLVQTCGKACQFHVEMIKNALWILARKNLFLDTKMYYISHKTIKERLTTYLDDQAISSNSSEFEIPFNREQLAEFLCVDRSALSRELGNMKDEGLIDYKKNWFKLL